MSPQIAVRLPAPLLGEVDALVDTGRYETRAEAIRAGIEHLVEAERRRRIGDAIVDGYARRPQAEDRDEELGDYPDLGTPVEPVG
jgi:Arc/MetJ-type ribon-helix-helix transcriptional regulator